MTKIEMIQQIINVEGQCINIPEIKCTKCPFSYYAYDTNIKCRLSYLIRFEGDIKSYIINIAASILTKEELFELLI